MSSPIAQKKRPAGTGVPRALCLRPVARGGAFTRNRPQVVFSPSSSGLTLIGLPSCGSYDAEVFLNGGWPARSCRVQAYGDKSEPMRYSAPLLGLLLIGATAASEPAVAQPNRAREGVRSGEVRSLDQILNDIRRSRPGNLADVEGPNAGPSGEPHYRLKWVTPDGRVQWLDTDARTGRVLGVEGDDRGGPRGGPPGPPQGPYGPQRGPFGPRGNFNEPPPNYGP